MTLRSAFPALGLALCLVANVAFADVVAVVSTKSPVTSLTRSQVADIFLGKTRRLPDGTAAVPIDQPEGADIRTEFYERFAARSPAQMKAHWSKIIFTGRGQPPAVAENGTELKRRLAANPAAIGYIDRSLLDTGLRELP